MLLLGALRFVSEDPVARLDLSPRAVVFIQCSQDGPGSDSCDPRVGVIFIVYLISSSTSMGLTCSLGALIPH